MWGSGEAVRDEEEDADGKKRNGLKRTNQINSLLRNYSWKM